MEKSKFQFTNPRLEQLEFVVNSDFHEAEGVQLDIQANFNVQYFENDGHNEFDQAAVAVTLKVGSKGSTAPFYIEAVETANFRWQVGAFDEAGVKRLLEQNGAALLISYLRPIISGVTAASPYPAYNLPYLDLTAREDT